MRRVRRPFFFSLSALKSIESAPPGSRPPLGTDYATNKNRRGGAQQVFPASLGMTVVTFESLQEAEPFLHPASCFILQPFAFIL